MDTFALSGSECVVALCGLGFEVVRRQPGLTMLRRNRRLVLVPDVLILPKSLLDAILTDADLSFAALISALDDVPTNPKLRMCPS